MIKTIIVLCKSVSKFYIYNFLLFYSIAENKTEQKLLNKLSTQNSDKKVKIVICKTHIFKITKCKVKKRDEKNFFTELQESLICDFI